MYYHVAINLSHTKHLCFVWNGQIYKFKALCFGVKNAPFTFNRLGQTSRKFFNLRGISIIIYIDDILILSKTFENNRMICELPQEKLQNIKSLCKVILANTRVSVRLRQKLMGFVTSTRPAVPMTKCQLVGTMIGQNVWNFNVNIKKNYIFFYV